jgi:hypothetical protein
MLNATRMNINRGPKLGESPGRAGVVKMNMTEEDVPNVVSRRTKPPKRSYDIVKGRLRSGVEKDKALIRFQRGRCNDAQPADLNGVEGVNFQKRVVIGYQLSVNS